MTFFLIGLPLIPCFLFCFVSKTNILLIRNFSLFWSLLILNICCLLLLFFDTSAGDFQFIFINPWFNSINITLIFGIDGLAYAMILLTAFLIPICVLLCWNNSLKNQIKDYCISFFLLESVLFCVFSSLDILLFYLFFEAVLIPMFLIVGLYGSRQRRIRAAYLLFLYTLISSLILFLAILYIFFKFGTTNYIIIKPLVFDTTSEHLCWFAFFLSFAVKMPIVPFHIWLPEAHCEAPTGGSVILAGILLKLGGFGFLRYSIGLFADSSAFFAPFVFLVSVLGIVYASLTTIQQVDLKKIIAYSSVGHMGVVTIGIFSFNSQAIIGSILLMVSHGIVSGALFLCIGILYEKHNTRIIKYFSGLLATTPIFASFFTVFTMANIGLPGTSSFIGEFLIILGCFLTNSVASFFCASGMVLGAAYSLWLLNRIFFGNLQTFSINQYHDLNRLEFCYLLPFVFLTLMLGFFPELIAFFIYLV